MKRTLSSYLGIAAAVAAATLLAAACGGSDNVVVGVDGGNDDAGLDATPGHDATGGDAGVDAAHDASMPDGSPTDGSTGDAASDSAADSAVDSAADAGVDGAADSAAPDSSTGDDASGDDAADGSGGGDDAATGDDASVDAGPGDGGSSDADAADAAPVCSLNATWFFNEDSLALTSGPFTCGLQSGCSSQADCSVSFLATSSDPDGGVGIEWHISVPGNICNDYPSTIDSQGNFMGSADDCEANGVADLVGTIDFTTCIVTGSIHYVRGGGGCEYTLTFDSGP
jgi:hypothetical protein